MAVAFGLGDLSGDGDLYALLADGNERFESKKVISKIRDSGRDVTKTEHGAPRDDRCRARGISPAVAQQVSKPRLKVVKLHPQTVDQRRRARRVRSHLLAMPAPDTTHNPNCPRRALLLAPSASA